MVNCLTPEETEVERDLGIIWSPGRYSFKFSVRINLSPLKKKLRVFPDLTKEELLNNALVTISRRQYYSQVKALFDPTSFCLQPYYKERFCQTWEGECKQLEWDEPLPDRVGEKIFQFFISLY